MIDENAREKELDLLNSCINLKLEKIFFLAMENCAETIKDQKITNKKGPFETSWGFLLSFEKKDIVITWKDHIYTSDFEISIVPKNKKNTNYESLVIDNVTKDLLFSSIIGSRLKDFKTYFVGKTKNFEKLDLVFENLTLQFIENSDNIIMKLA
jgi:hypothetical protein